MREGGQLEVEGTAEEVRARIAAALPTVGSLWFPSPKDMRAWRQTSSPVYVRLRAGRAFEIGPRLPSVVAARFCPVLRVGMEPAGDRRTRLELRLRFLPLTTSVLAIWVLLIGLWGTWIAGLAAAGESVWAWVVFWVVILISTLVGPLVGWREGRRILEAARPRLEALLAEPAAEGEDW